MDTETVKNGPETSSPNNNTSPQVSNNNSSPQQRSPEEEKIATVPDASGDIFLARTITPIGDGQQSELILGVLPSIRLTFCQKLAIASGHFQNDLCAALWFSYLLLYLEKVVGFTEIGARTSSYPGTLMLIGQLVDGIATPLVGYEVDQTNIWPKNYGRCKSWHLWGSMMVLVSFPFIFSPMMGGSANSAPWVKMIYYAPFIAIFQIGWAAVQISHLAIIPKMHPDELVRTELFSMRYAFTVIANISIFIMTFIKLRTQQEYEVGTAKCEVDKDDTNTFMILSIAAIAFGSLATLFFHFGTKEETDDKVKEKVAAITSRTELIRRLSVIPETPELNIQTLSSARRRRHSSATSRHSLNPSSYGEHRSDEDRISHSAPLLDDHSVEARLSLLNEALAEIEQETQISVTTIPSTYSTKSLSIGKDVMTISDWLSLPQTYMVAFVYMSTRLSINLGQVYIPFYVQDSLHMDCTTVALIPLTMYISGFFLSIVIKVLNKHFGRQLSYAVGVALVFIGSTLVLSLDWDGPHQELLKGYIIYVVAVLLGAGASAILVTSLSITADLIGNNIDSGAFVYGGMSFCDKVSCGLVILLIDSLVPCPGPADGSCNKEENVVFYRNVLGYSVGGCAILGGVGVILLTIQIVRQNRRKAEEESNQRRNELK